MERQQHVPNKLRVTSRTPLASGSRPTILGTTYTLEITEHNILSLWAEKDGTRTQLPIGKGSNVSYECQLTKGELKKKTEIQYHLQGVGKGNSVMKAGAAQ